jgi:hypothetical protein
LTLNLGKPKILWMTTASPTSEKATAPKLLDQMRAVIHTMHYSIRTEDAYVDWARRYILFHDKRHPRSMGAAEVGAFLTHLATERIKRAGLAFPAHPAAPAPAQPPDRHREHAETLSLEEFVKLANAIGS